MVSDSTSFDADGGILTRRDGTLSRSTFTEAADSRQQYANGQQVATLGEDGTIDAASQLTAFDSSDLGNRTRFGPGETHAAR